MEYKVIAVEVIRDDSSEFDKKVVQHLEEGWNLYGDLRTILLRNAVELFTQVVTRG
jgi:hypothetical protein